MKKNLHLAVLLLCLFPTVTQSAVSQDKNINIAIGNYDDSKLESLVPLLSVSLDGSQWTYPTSIVTERPDSTTITINNADCSRYFCAATGYYYLNQNSMPLLAMSKNNGATWSYIATLPKNFMNATLDQIKCNSSFCIAVGAGDNVEKQFLPILISSSDGASWSSANILNLPQDLTSGEFNTTTCDDNACLAAGKFQIAKQTNPLIAVSTDNGNSWHYSSDIVTKEPAILSYSTYYDFSITNVSCNANTCVLGGTYFNSKEAYLPFLAVSNDKGVTWNYPKSIFANMPGGVHQTEVNKVVCDQQACIAVGKSNPPFLAVSTDKGVTWNYPRAIISDLPKDYSDGEFDDVSCNNNVCIAVGHYIPKNQYVHYPKPLVAVSYDHGNTWSYSKNIPTPGFSTLLSNVSCSEESCIATGSYLRLGFIAMPLLMITKDRGVTWSTPGSITSNLPSSFVDGGFTSVVDLGLKNSVQ